MNHFLLSPFLFQTKPIDPGHKAFWAETAFFWAGTKNRAFSPDFLTSLLTDMKMKT